MQVLTFFDLQGVEKWGQMGFEALFFAASFFLTWLALSYRRHETR